MSNLLSLAERINAVVQLDPAADAIEFQGKWYRWGEIAASVKALRELLRQAGLGAGTPIGVLLRNRPQHAFAIAAVLGNEACIVTMNALQPREKTCAELAKLKLPVVIADSEEWADQKLKTLICEGGALAIELNRESGMRALSEFSGERTMFREDRPGVAIEMLTSGTTGDPKRVIFGTKNLKRSILGAARLIPGSIEGQVQQEPKLLLRRGIVVCWAPLQHVSGMWSVIEHLLQGRRICLLEKFEPNEWARVVRTYKPRMAMLSPPVIRMILDAGIAKENLQSLEGVTSGTAPLSPQLEREFETTYELPVLPAYGATEFPGSGAGWNLDDHKVFGESKLGSVGRARPGVKIRIVDQQTGDPLPGGEVGLIELFARTAATPDDQEVRWIRTTDLGCLDEDDFLWIKGRADAAIIRGGFKILPGEVVKVLERHPGVLEASVVGIAEPRLGQVPVAAVIPRDWETAPTPEELQAHAREYLSAYQVPVMFKVVNELPRTPSLKVSMPGVQALFSGKPVAQ